MSRRSCKGRVIACFLILLVSILLQNKIASAELQRTELFNLEETSNMVITLYYDVAEPEIQIYAPDGKKVDLLSLEKETEEGMVSYYIKKASAGQWYMDYEKGANTDLELNYSPYSNQITIEKLTLTPPETEGGTAALSFLVDGDSELLCNYEIFAVRLGGDEQISGRKLLTQGTGQFNEEMTVEVPLTALASFDSYHLVLSVWGDDYGIEVSDERITEETLSVQNPEAYEAMKGVFAQINLTHNSLTLDWSKFSVYCDEYLLGVFDAAGKEEIYTNSFNGNETQTKISLPENCKSVLVELTYFNGEQRSETLHKEIPVDNGLRFLFPENSYGNESFLKIACQGVKQPFSVHVTVNDWEEDVDIKTDGSFSVAMQNFDNEIQLAFSPSDENTVYLQEYKMTVDMTAPILKLPEHSAKIVTNEGSFSIAGVTESGCEVIVNQTKIPVALDGTFLATVELLNGENSFEISAVDLAGNASVQTIRIEKMENKSEAGKKGGFPYLPMVVAFAGSVIFLVCVLVLSAAYQKKKKESKKLAVCALLRNSSLLLTIIFTAAFSGAMIYLLMLKDKLKGEKLFAFVSESLPEALKKVLTVQKLEKLAIGTGIAALSFLFLFLLFLFLYKWIQIPKKEKKQKETRNKKSKKEKTEEKTVEDTGSLTEKSEKTKEEDEQKDK